VLRLVKNMERYASFLNMDWAYVLRGYARVNWTLDPVEVLGRVGCGVSGFGGGSGLRRTCVTVRLKESPQCINQYTRVLSGNQFEVCGGAGFSRAGLLLLLLRGRKRVEGRFSNGLQNILGLTLRRCKAEEEKEGDCRGWIRRDG
jgi:hypothetical protein